jgi:hypothetical protein
MKQFKLQKNFNLKQELSGLLLKLKFMLVAVAKVR